jgi:hypothetical protein
LAIGIPQYQCARIEWDRGNAEAAKSDFAQAQAIAARIKDIKTDALSEVGLANADLSAGAWREASARLSKSAKTLSGIEEVAMEAQAQAMLALCFRHLGNDVEFEVALRRAGDLRQRVTTHLDGFLIDVFLLRATGSTREAGDAPIRKLRELAAQAEAQKWLPLALEADIAALELLETAGSPDARALRSAIAGTARKHGFRAVLGRLLPNQ